MNPKSSGGRPRTVLPVGYRRGSGSRTDTPVLDIPKARYIVLLFDRVCASRQSLDEIAYRLAESGFRTSEDRAYSERDLRHILKNPFYAGYVYKDGRLVRGAHQPLVDSLTFFIVQQTLWPETWPKRVSAFCLRLCTRLSP